MCNRKFGVGADGMLEGPVLDGEQISMVVWNPDGSVAQKSGNGVQMCIRDRGNTQGGQAEYRKDIGKARYALKTVGTVGNGVKHGGCNERPDISEKPRVAMAR